MITIEVYSINLHRAVNIKYTYMIIRADKSKYRFSLFLLSSGTVGQNYDLITGLTFLKYMVIHI